jgi:hypothetical protein
VSQRQKPTRRSIFSNTTVETAPLKRERLGGQSAETLPLVGDARISLADLVN